MCMRVRHRQGNRQSNRQGKKAPVCLKEHKAPTSNKEQPVPDSKREHVIEKTNNFGIFVSPIGLLVQSFCLSNRFIRPLVSFVHSGCGPEGAGEEESASRAALVKETEGLEEHAWRAERATG